MSDPIEPQASGGYLNAAIVDQASVWLVKLWSGVATAEDHEACARWRAAHADHERAWQRLLAFEQKLQVVPSEIARETLKHRSISTSRRRTLKSLGAVLAGSAATYAVGSSTAWQRYAADYRTSTGERRTILLADASQAILNTASAIDVRFDSQQRLIDLKSGEILIRTAPDRDAQPPRPFIVTTSHGTVRALGTRFTVRRTDDDVSHVAVFEGAVSLQPKLGTHPLRLDAGQQAFFSRTAGQDVRPADESAFAWVDGTLMAERMRLDAFIAELSRYRPGLLRCDPAAGHFLLTGVYPLADTDRILASIEHALPIQVIYRHRYWVTVTARDA